MKIERVISSEVAEPAEKMWSNCIKVGETVYISGLTARSSDGVTIDGQDEYEQTRIIFSKMKNLVVEAGGSMADIAKLNIYVTNIDARKLVWDARAEFFEGDFPACALVEVSSLAAEEIRVEIEGVAHLGAGVY